MPKGRENVYVCQKCGRHLVTIDRDEGITPFLTPCTLELRGKPLCNGWMESSCYPTGPKPPHIGPVTHEWYNPTPEELAAECEQRKHSPGAPTAIRQHVRRGGLLLRPVATLAIQADTQKASER